MLANPTPGRKDKQGQNNEKTQPYGPSGCASFCQAQLQMWLKMGKWTSAAKVISCKVTLARVTLIHVTGQS